MKRTVWFTLVVVSTLSALSAWSIGVVAQVYESKEKGGVPVFSDTPTQGAKPVDLPPPNVVNTPQPAQPQAPSAPAAPSYVQLAILAPAQQDTVHTNTGAFDVQVSLAPTLRPGDAFVVTLDGNALPGRYTSANISLTEQDYASAAAATHQHSLSVAVVDSNGNVLMSSNAVSFYVDRSTIRRGRTR